MHPSDASTADRGLEDTTCALCGTTSDDVAIEQDGFQVRRCSSCGLLYVSPRPNAASIRSLYGHDDAHISADAHIASEAATRASARHLLGHVGRHRHKQRGSTLLELGAGAGYLLDEARDLGYDVHGIEMNPVQASFMRDTLDIPCEVEPISEGSFSGRRFEVIVHVDVLSHLVDPVADFQVICSKLTDGGLLVFETGNFADVAPRHYKAIETFQLPDHLTFFGDKTLLELLRRAGFELVDVRRFSLLPELMATNLGRRLVRFMRSLRPGRAAPAREATGLLRARASDRGPSRVIRRLVARTFVWLRYGAGRFGPKKARPQTLLVFARPMPPGTAR